MTRARAGQTTLVTRAFAVNDDLSASLSGPHLGFFTVLQ